MISESWLFVCYGNICRSPIAENLARRMLGPDSLIDSAGTNSWADRAATETCEMLAEEYGIDISSHRPKRLEDVPLAVFDHVVALSADVRDFLNHHYPQVREKLICWEIADPYEMGGPAFMMCALEIEKQLKKEFGRAD